MRSTSSFGIGFLRDLSNLFLLAGLLAFSLFLWASYQTDDASSYLLPRALAIFGIVVSSIQLWVGYFSRREPVSEEAGERKGISVQVAIAFTTVYFLLVPLLGFVLATAFAIATFSYLTGFPRKRLVVILAVVIPMLLHLTFVGLLKAPLPGGFLGALPF